MKKINYIIIVIFSMFPNIVFGKDLNIYLFYNTTCQYCKKEITFFDRYLPTHRNVHLYKYPINNNSENSFKWSEVKEITGVVTGAVPYLVVGDNAIVGYTSDETTGEYIKDAINYCLENDCPDRVGVYLGVSTDAGTGNKPESNEEAGDSSETENTFTDESTNETVEEEEETQGEAPTTYNWYTITYNLANGHFIDGSASNRKQVVREDKVIGEFKTNPIKKGYRFLYWKDSNGNKFDVTKEKLNSDITLTAVYEKYEETKLYCPDGYEFDPSSAVCYTALKTYTDKEPYNFTMYTYKANERICYKYYGNQDKPGKITRISGTTSSATGKNNDTSGVYTGWTSDAWMEVNTCKFGSSCTKGGSTTNWYKYDTDCVITWKTILYKETEPLIKETNSNTNNDNSNNNNNSDNSNNNTNNNNSNNGGGKKSETEKEATSSPATGDSLIWIFVIFLIGAISYSIYYFKNMKEDENKLL